MNFPDNLMYSKEHEWIRFEEDGTAFAGITDYAQRELGEIVYVDVTTVGETLQQDEIFGSVEAVKAVSDLFIPVAGKMLEVNPGLEDNPELLNKDPYGEGWIIRIMPENRKDISGLLTASEYKALIGIN